MSEFKFNSVEEAIEDFKLGKMVIVVDDGSTDRSVDVVKQYIDNNGNIKLIMHPDKKNHGLNESLKLAVVKSKGEYIAFCEADDILHPDNIAKKIRLVK